MIVQAEIINVQMYTRCRGSTYSGADMEVLVLLSQRDVDPRYGGVGSGVLIWRCCGYQNEVFVQVLICVGAG